MKRKIATMLIKDFHERPLPLIVDRDLELKLSSTKRAISIIGPRRAGKPYFLFNTMARLKEIEKTKMLYINVEDDRLLPLDLTVLDTLLNTYYEIYPENRKKRVYLFLDEIQNIDEWEQFVRRILDTENIQVFLSGSSSKMLSKEIATSMRGRAISHLILPFSFGEFLKAKGFKIERYLSSDKKAWLMNHMEEYLRFGGFPEIVLDDDELSKVRTLKEYVEVMLIRDVVERNHTKNIKVLRMLLDAMLASFGKEFSVHKFYNFLKSQGIQVSKNTLYGYFQHFEDAFAVLPIRRFSYSLREVEQSLPKIYQIDNGYAAQLGLRTSENLGRLMENLAAIELFRRASMNPLLDYYYWKDHSGEVDFALKEGNKIVELIQICYDIDDWNTKLRETKALIKASEELDCNNLKIITWDIEDEETLDGKSITYIPLWKWLLDMG